VSDFSDEDFEEEDELERQAVRFVEEFQTWLNQSKEFQLLMRTKIQDLLGLHKALEEENFAHELRCLAYVFDGELQHVPQLMKNNSASFWQEKVRNRAFTLKNLSATQIYSKLLSRQHTYFETCLNYQIKQNLDTFSNLTVRQLTKSAFRKTCRDVGMTQIETHLFVKLISGAKGPTKAKLDAYVKEQK